MVSCVLRTHFFKKLNKQIIREKVITVEFSIFNILRYIRKINNTRKAEVNSLSEITQSPQTRLKIENSFSKSEWSSQEQ